MKKYWNFEDLNHCYNHCYKGKLILAHWQY